MVKHVLHQIEPHTHIKNISQTEKHIKWIFSG
jgi:hypothetical protein